MEPAWSSQFEPGALQPVAPLPLDAPITRDWAWGGATGAGVRVAIIDSGVDAAHPAVGAVAGAVAVEPDDGAPGGVRVVPAEGDLFGHGTACAGIICATAPEAEVYSVRVLGSNLRGRGSAFAGGLRWAIDHEMHVVNMSLSTRKRDYFALFHELADEAYFRGIMLVSAVDNVEGPTYPSQYSSVFSVAAHARRDPLGFDFNPSPPAEFGAPGIDVEVAWLDGSTVRATGNSFAAPHIAGLVARILSKHPGLKPFQMKTVL
ncbi:MAG TPA: S8 family serine peptidase, partial [Egibacteraceae bacterium]|nr:S8 family serine peptidase [Egibacteraceae bacterium]